MMNKKERKFIHRGNKPLIHERSQEGKIKGEGKEKMLHNADTRIYI